MKIGIDRNNPNHILFKWQSCPASSERRYRFLSAFKSIIPAMHSSLKRYSRAITPRMWMVLIHLVLMGSPQLPAVEIPDPVLNRVIREELGMEGQMGEIDEDQLGKLSYLNYDPGKTSRMSERIHSLVGLEAATDLQDIHLPNNAIADLSPIRNLRRIKRLNLSNNQIKSVQLSDLAEQGSTLDLDFSSNRITDITFFGDWIDHRNPLNGNTTYRLSVDLGHNQISDLSSLSHLSGLNKLLVAGNPLTRLPETNTWVSLRTIDLSETAVPGLTGISASLLSEIRLRECPDFNLESIRIARLTHLRVLDMSGSPISDLSSLSTLRIEHFIANDCPISDLTPLADSDVSSLEIARTEVTSLEPFRGKTLSLSLLNLASTAISDLQPIMGQRLAPSSFRSGARIDLSNSAVTDLSPLARTQSHLYQLVLDDTQLEDLSSLEGLSIAELSLQRVPATDFSVLKNVIALTVLDVSETAFSDFTLVPATVTTLIASQVAATDFTPLANLHRLESIDLSHTAFTDLTHLPFDDERAVQRIQRLELDSCQLESLTPVASFIPTDIEYLGLANTGISDPTPLGNLRILQADLSGNEITDLAPLANLEFLDSRIINTFPPIESLPRQIDLRNNALDIRPGSETRLIIDGWNRDADIHVLFSPQRDSSYLWAKARPTVNSWLISEWFGWIRETPSLWYQHLEHGWQWSSSPDTTSVWIWDASLGAHLWTSEEIYPWIYLVSPDGNARWLYYLSPTVAPLRWFFDQEKWVREDDLKSDFFQ
jgi:internalin A